MLALRPALQAGIVVTTVDQPDVQRAVVVDKLLRQCLAGRAFLADEQRQTWLDDAADGRQRRVKPLPRLVVGTLERQLFLHPLMLFTGQQLGEALAFGVAVGFHTEGGEGIESRRPDAALALTQLLVVLPFTVG